MGSSKLSGPHQHLQFSQQSLYSFKMEAIAPNICLHSAMFKIHRRGLTQEARCSNLHVPKKGLPSGLALGQLLGNEL